MDKVMATRKEDEIDEKEFMKKVRTIIEKERNFLERVGRL